MYIDAYTYAYTYAYECVTRDEACDAAGTASLRARVWNGVK